MKVADFERKTPNQQLEEFIPQTFSSKRTDGNRLAPDEHLTCAKQAFVRLRTKPYP